MKTLEAWGEKLGMNFPAQIALLLILTIVLWTTGMPFSLSHAHAANVSQFSDTLSTSNIGTISKDVIQFTTATSTFAGSTIKIQLDPVGSAFVEYYSAATTTDITATGFTEVADVGSCAGGNTAYPTASYNNGTDENLTFTVCPGATITPGTITITVGAVTKLWQNPSASGSYRIVLSGGQTGETRVAILQNVTLTAAVNTAFTFTVTGLATSTNVNGENTTETSFATQLPFNTLASGTPQVLGQQLQVTTNANNGFAVTVQENQPPTSGSGAIIYPFKDGATTSVPTVWTKPRAILDAQQTYGHFGITSDDTDEGCAIQFVGCTGEFTPTTTTPYVGNILTPRTVFTHSGPSDGLTQNKGLAKVAYKIEISDLQAAGNDYTNTITYVATPTF
jgi:hypothetical protein